MKTREKSENIFLYNTLHWVKLNASWLRFFSRFRLFEITKTQIQPYCVIYIHLFKNWPKYKLEYEEFNYEINGGVMVIVFELQIWEY